MMKIYKREQQSYNSTSIVCIHVTTVTVLKHAHCRSSNASSMYAVQKSLDASDNTSTTLGDQTERLLLAIINLRCSCTVTVSSMKTKTTKYM